jgi:hypothetical protein
MTKLPTLAIPICDIRHARTVVLFVCYLFVICLVFVCYLFGKTRSQFAKTSPTLQNAAKAREMSCS